VRSTSTSNVAALARSDKAVTLSHASAIRLHPGGAASAPPHFTLLILFPLPGFHTLVGFFGSIDLL
jgi:hypothetical protein